MRQKRQVERGDDASVPLRQRCQHSSGQQYAGDVDEVEGAQHLQPRQQQASAAMHKTDGREQRATAEDGSGDGECACRPRQPAAAPAMPSRSSGISKPGYSYHRQLERKKYDRLSAARLYATLGSA